MSGILEYKSNVDCPCNTVWHVKKTSLLNYLKGRNGKLYLAMLTCTGTGLQTFGIDRISVVHLG